MSTIHVKSKSELIKLTRSQLNKRLNEMRKIKIKINEHPDKDRLQNLKNTAKQEEEKVWNELMRRKESRPKESHYDDI